MTKQITPSLRPTLRGMVLSLAVLMLSSFMAQAIPYASQVTTNGTTISFVLNQAAQGLVVLRDGANPVYPGTTAGPLTFSMAGFSTWSIIVTGNTTRAWTQFIPDGTDRNFWGPRGVAVNKNPASTNFGKVYVSNGRYSGNTGAGRLTPDGIYILRADGVAEGGVKTGGVDWTVDGTAASHPWRCTVGPDDHVYVASRYTNNVYEFNEDLSSASLLLEAANKTTDQWVSSVWVEGTKAAGNRSVYTLDGNYYAGAPGRKGLIRYDLVSADNAFGLGTGTQVIGPSYYTYYPYDVTRDTAGYFYLCQYRSTAGQAACFSKFDVTGTLPVNTDVYAASSAYTVTACIDVHTPSGRVAVGRDSTGNQVYLFDAATGAFVEQFAAGATSARARELAYDAAGNIVTVDNISEYARFWSPGGTSVATTMSDGTFTVFTPDNLSVAATDAAGDETGPDAITFTISRSGGPANNLQVYFTMGGTATSNVDYTLSVTSPFTFAAGMTTTNITVTPIDDSEREATETVVLTVATDANYNVLGTASSATGSIVDNDAVYRYWDTNGITAGPIDVGGDAAPGTWGTDAYWSSSAAGDVATTAWTDWTVAVFSAGTEATGLFTVNVNGSQKVDTLSFEEGTVTLDGGTLTLTNFTGVKIAASATAAINSVLAGGAGLTIDGPGILNLGGANTYTGPTMINGGTVTMFTAGAIPDGTDLSLGTGANLNLNIYGKTVASLTGATNSILTVPGGQDFTFGSSGANTVWNGDESGGGRVIKVGSGTTTVSGSIADALAISNGVISFNASARLGTGNEIVLDNGSMLESTSAGVGADFVAPDRTFTIGPGNGTLKLTDSGAILMVRDNSVISGPGTLTKDGGGELRTYSVQHTFAKLFVKAGLYTCGHSTLLGYNTSFGAIPASPTADAITLYGDASIRKAGGQNVVLDPNQGITLAGAGTKTIRAYSGNTNSAGWNATGTFVIPGTISGTGPLQWGLSTDGPFTPIFVVGANNTYSGDTTLTAGSFFATNTTGSATGTGTLTVGAIGTNVLGGDGIIGGPVVMNAASTLSPGYSFFVGAATPDPTVVTKPIATLRLGNGLNMSAGTNAWQLAALSVANPGTDFDQVQMTGGNLTLGGTSVLNIGFTGTATAPSLAEPFWQANRQWKVIALSGGGSVSGNFVAITGTNGITAGSFSTTTDATGVTLNFTTSYSPLASVTNTTIATGPGSDLTISYSGGGGSQFVLLQTNNVGAPLANWARVKTNSTSPGSFTVTPGSESQLFYRVQSE